jgi:hypothetical protein
MCQPQKKNANKRQGQVRYRKLASMKLEEMHQNQAISLDLAYLKQLWNKSTSNKKKVFNTQLLSVQIDFPPPS